ncbi:hypothetical protein RR42_m1957 [Cupriavidus basilensis]|uniref:Uncharacterized protein n=1 Tax=Cupriavidus basilensis TaxID=68895 RepID=A0A0C4Y2I1_9BURK|nr:hypothetical protein RR42_m1957 [Cupriavidus basilensis]
MANIGIRTLNRRHTKHSWSNSSGDHGSDHAIGSTVRTCRPTSVRGAWMRNACLCGISDWPAVRLARMRWPR